MKVLPAVLEILHWQERDRQEVTVTFHPRVHVQVFAHY